jgi:hypothetical protein
MADSRRRTAFAAPVLAVPAVLALTEDHLAAGPAALVLSTVAAALAVYGMSILLFLCDLF